MRLALIGCAFVALATSCLANANSERPVLEMNADGEIHIDTDGRVTAYDAHSKLSPTIEKLVSERVQTWTFVPVLVDGKAVAAKSAMHLHLRATPVPDDKYRLEIADVNFGGPKLSPGSKPPHYPSTALRARVGARVLLYVKIDDSGTVADVQVYQTSLDARASSEMEAERYRKVFELVSVEAARHWHYDLTETVNGKAVGTVAAVPMLFYLNNAGTGPVRSGEWKAYVPGPVHEVPWAPRKSSLSDTAMADLGNGEAGSLDSHLKLRDDVVGKTL